MASADAERRRRRVARALEQLVHTAQAAGLANTSAWHMLEPRDSGDDRRYLVMPSDVDTTLDVRHMLPRDRVGAVQSMRVMEAALRATPAFREARHAPDAVRLAHARRELDWQQSLPDDLDARRGALAARHPGVFS